MTNENQQRLQEEREDAELKLLMEEYAQIEGEALWREYQAAQAAGNDPEHCSTQNRNPGRGSDESNRRIHFLKRLGKGIKRAAIIFLVMICLLSPLVMSVEAFKIPVLNYFVVLKKTFSGFNFRDNVGLNPEQESILRLIYSTPVPDNYKILNYRIGENGKIWIDFECDGELVMILTIYPSNGQINYDTEDISQIPMKIHDYEAVYIQKDGHRIMWMDAERELVFDIFAFQLDEASFWQYVYGLLSFLT